MKGLVCLLIPLLAVSCWSAEEEDETAEDRWGKQCPADIYCDGEHMPMVTALNRTYNHRKVRCDLVPDPKKHCCLSGAKHLVCYSIVVDGNYLNYDVDKPLQSTDFTELCKILLLAQGKTPGQRHSSISVNKNGGGQVAFRYGEFVDLARKGTNHIKDLACEVE